MPPLPVMRRRKGGQIRNRAARNGGIGRLAGDRGVGGASDQIERQEGRRERMRRFHTDYNPLRPTEFPARQSARRQTAEFPLASHGPTRLYVSGGRHIPHRKGLAAMGRGLACPMK